MQDRMTTELQYANETYVEPPGKFIPGGSFFDLRLFTRAF